MAGLRPWGLSFGVPVHSAGSGRIQFVSQQPRGFRGVRCHLVILGTPTAGGQQYLNPAVFRDPALRGSDALGTLGRNSIIGPGFFSVDASVTRTFSFRHLGDSGRITIRSDWFNVLNHRGLGLPSSCLRSIPRPIPDGQRVQSDLDLVLRAQPTLPTPRCQLPAADL